MLKTARNFRFRRKHPGACHLQYFRADKSNGKGNCASAHAGGRRSRERSCK